jgi:DNA-directed RNA polymerase subunit beta'
MSQNIDYLQIQLASPKEIERWSHRVLPNNQVVGEITKADTINYRTFKPERDGLFCERIFGSISNNECSCGKTRRRKPMQMKVPSTLDGEMEPLPPNAQDETLGYVCPTCGVEPTDAKVRRYRMGCIRLRRPVAHLWYFRNTPNMLAVLLNMTAYQADAVVHFNTYTPAAFPSMNYLMHGGTEWYMDEWLAVHVLLGRTPPRLTGENPAELEVAAVWNLDAWAPTDRHRRKWGLDVEPQTTDNCGAEAMHMLLSELDLPFIERMLSYRLRQKVHKYHALIRTKQADGAYYDPDEEDTDLQLTRQGQRKRGLNAKIKTIAKRLHYVRLLARKQLRPEWMIVSVFPVLPPDLRPMIQMSSGRFAASDLNDLYRRLIYRKIRYDKFCSLFDADFLPDLLIRHDLCLLQEAADAIIDNGRLEKPAQRPNKSVFKSLTAIIEGKHGRFRQNLLGKRVDYSGRSVIVVGPKLRLHQCGLPREMALELFHPFLIQALLEHTVVRNIRAAKNLIQKRTQKVWDMLERVVYAHPLLLNRAPTLHRLGIQAFEPILLSGRAIQLHPLVCPAFNADFDGDQMAVHIPLSLEAQAEARLLMLATHNWLSPATGEPTIVPSQDMILGFYYLTTRRMTPAPPAFAEAMRPVSLAPPVAQKNVHQLAWDSFTYGPLDLRTADSSMPWVRGGSFDQPFNVFQTFARVLQCYALGVLTVHELVWVKSQALADAEQPMPVQVRVYSSGHNTCIYDSGAVESWPSPTRLWETPSPELRPVRRSVEIEPVFGLVPQCHHAASHTFYLRTTPGRLIFNSLLYEHIFL